jgi:hypothetical protein
MRKVTYTDRRGYKKVALVRDTDPDEAAAQGLPLGPPDLDELDFEEVKKEINNALVQNGLLSLKDMPRQPNAITIAVRAAMVPRIVALFKAQEAVR